MKYAIGLVVAIATCFLPEGRAIDDDYYCDYPVNACDDEFLIYAEVTSELPVPKAQFLPWGVQQFKIEILKSYREADVLEFVSPIIQTYGRGASCDVDLKVGKKYLLSGLVEPDIMTDDTDALELWYWNVNEEIDSEKSADLHVTNITNNCTEGKFNIKRIASGNNGKYDETQASIRDVFIDEDHNTYFNDDQNSITAEIVVEDRDVERRRQRNNWIKMLVNNIH